MRGFGFGTYCAAVAQHWSSLLWSALSAAGACTGLTLVGFTTWSPRTIGAIVLFGLFVAQYRAWVDAGTTTYAPWTSPGTCGTVHDLVRSLPVGSTAEITFSDGTHATITPRPVTRPEPTPVPVATPELAPGIQPG